MRFPYPERFRWKSVFLFTVLLFVAELAVGTDVRFAALVSLFTVLFAGGVNRAGGLNYASGAYIFFNGLLICLLGVVFKTLLLEPGETHLKAPYTTMLVYCGGMASMWLAAEANHLLRPRRGFLSSFVNQDTMMQSAIGCFVMGLGITLVFSGPRVGGSVGAALSEVNRFPQFAIILATLHAIRVSGGRRAWNWLVIAQVVILFSFGVLYTSKEGMFQGPVTWLVTAVAARFDFKPKLIFGGAVFMFVMIFYMVPYSQYVRLFRDESNSVNRAVTLDYLFRLDEVRGLYKDSLEASDAFETVPHYYNAPQGLMDRLAAISMDDAIINRTQEGFVFGIYPTYHGIINMVPTFIWRNKPFFFTGNEYARELGFLPADDVTTGVSFSPQADSYHQAKWYGIFIIMPLVCFAYFLANDSFVGSVRDSPWPLLLIILAAHLAPEGGIDSMLLQVAEGSIGILFMAVVIRYVLPLLIRVASGNEKTIVRKTLDFRQAPQPRRRAESTQANSATP